ncbi:scopolin beta-glucosidase [Aureococcus anophagefferens]|nr:scopolin beta-glucosidase [Aureococcus anophagefferens]
MKRAVVAIACCCGAAGGDVAALVAAMTREEKHGLLNGHGWQGWDLLPGYYVGNTRAVPRLGIPALKMQDAGQGFRTTDAAMIGTVTSWPCAASRRVGTKASSAARAAAAREFKAKGANVVLGPGVNVHRVAAGGRNAEYLSGEDPHLGARLVGPYVRGFQDRGVLAVAKHFAFNQQETNRYTVSAAVDATTRFEGYYPPFEAAAAAGVAGVMCAYNRVDGVAACSSPDLLERDLRGGLGFQGFVVSDWAAAHAKPYTGCDVDMPGSGVEDAPNGSSWFEDLGDVDDAVIDAMASRVLGPVDALGLLGRDDCAPPDCDLYANATTAEHRALAREIATDAVVLLKNDGALPLDRGATVAVVGSACAALQNTTELLRRWDLGDYYVEAFLVAIAAATPTILVALAPGAVLLPDDDAVASLLVFLAGEFTGDAFADVLLGAASPSGHLPVTLPLHEDDVIAPCGDGACPYDEGLLFGHRGLEGKDVRYPFGHGLSYTDFDVDIEEVRINATEVVFQISVANRGRVAAKTVVQLYLEFPAAAHKVLTGCAKPALPAGESARVTLSLSRERDLRAYAAGGWAPVLGAYRAYVGLSSRDVRAATASDLPSDAPPAAERRHHGIVSVAGPTALLALIGLAVGWRYRRRRSEADDEDRDGDVDSPAIQLAAFSRVPNHAPGESTRHPAFV